MGKVINLNGEEVEMVSEYEALTYFKGRGGKCIKLKCFRMKVKRENIPHTRLRGGNRLILHGSNFLMELQ